MGELFTHGSLNIAVRLVLGTVLVLVVWISRAEANNGKVALAFPVEGIAVDGDLSDWPAKIERYPITITEYGDRPQGAEDFQGTFRVGYSPAENALYVAVEVADESTVIDTTDEGIWFSQDGCEVFVDIWNREQVSSVVQYVTWGTDTGRVYGSPEVIAQRQEEDVTSAVRFEAGYRWYEWRIDVNRLTGGEGQLRPGMALGFDVVVEDMDSDQTFSWVAWGSGRHKFWFGGYSNAEARGDLVLVEVDGGKGKIQGQIKWSDSGEGVKYGKIRVAALLPDTFQVQVVADREGFYSVELPAGRYRLEAAMGRGEKPGSSVELRPESQATVDLAVEPPRGRTAKAGRGRRPWQHFSIPDGLPSSLITDALEDQKGNLWFTTWGGGVVRHNGESFTAFSTEDGLPYNTGSSMLEDREGDLWFVIGEEVIRYDGERFAVFSGLEDSPVRCMLEGRNGDLWFGTSGRGVVRFDGENFTTLTTDDGLVDNTIISMLEDRQGNLWFGSGEMQWGSGLSRYDGREFVNFTTEDGLPSNLILAMLEDQRGNLWLATPVALARYDGERFESFTTEEGLPGNQVSCMLEDRQGNLWVGTSGGGAGMTESVLRASPLRRGCLMAGYPACWRMRRDICGSAYGAMA